MQRYQDGVKEVHFFGAGRLNPDRRERISNALSIIFKCAFISVEQDVLGVSYAICGTSKGLCCSLGTGSNSAFLVSFAPFMSEHVDSIYIADLLYVGFDEFIKTSIHCFSNYDR